MKQSVALTFALLSLSSIAALAGPPKKAAKKTTGKAVVKTAKLVQVMHCPITGEEVKDASGKTAKVDNYNVHFCCPGCDGQFAKLSKKDQLAKAKEASAKDAKPAAKKG